MASVIGKLGKRMDVDEAPLILNIIDIITRHILYKCIYIYIMLVCS